MKLTNEQVMSVASLEQSHGAMRRDDDSEIGEVARSEVDGAVYYACPDCKIGFVIEPTGETWEVISVVGPI